MKHKKFLIGLFIIAFLLTVGVTTANAYPGFFGFGKLGNGGPADKECTTEQCKTMQELNQKVETALENSDYSSWKSAIEEIDAKRFKITDVITEENFAKFVEAKKLMNDGKFDEAKKIIDELGLPGRGFGMMGMGHHGGPGGRGMGPGGCLNKNQNQN